MRPLPPVGGERACLFRNGRRCDVLIGRRRRARGRGWSSSRDRGVVGARADYAAEAVRRSISDFLRGLLRAYDLRLRVVFLFHLFDLAEIQIGRDVGADVAGAADRFD